MTNAAQGTLADALWPAERMPVLRAATMIVLGSLLLTASAKAHVPMWPVPMTMQTFVVLMIGLAYGRWLALATIGAYLLQGALGFPVFSGTPERGVGVAYMMGPTGGFLLGFLIAGGLLGWLAERGWDRSLPWLFAALAIGTVVPFVPGLAWLATMMGWEKAVTFGLTPFLAGAVVKLALAAACLTAAWRVIGAQR